MASWGPVFEISRQEGAAGAAVVDAARAKRPAKVARDMSVGCVVVDVARFLLMNVFRAEVSYYDLQRERPVSLRYLYSCLVTKDLPSKAGPESGGKELGGPLITKSFSTRTPAL